MIREDRVLLADLGRLNTDVLPLALRVMEGSETAEELHAFADRLVAMAVRLQARAAGMGLVIEGEITHRTARVVLGEGERVLLVASGTRCR